MSVEALTWAFNEAPDVRKCCVPVLLGLANHAHANGKGAYPGQKLLAHYARKTVRATQDCLKHLLEDKLIARGDQRHVAYIPADRRPVVYNLAMHRKREVPVDLLPEAEPVSGKAAAVPDMHEEPVQEPAGEPEVEPAPPARPAKVTGLAAFKAARQKLDEKRGAANPPASGTKTCRTHRGQPAHNCTPCKSEALGGVK
ncbi:hypothetical protein O7614_26470 [Micromonospora sp. WMMD961]|uniref:hypothetical protein n=1 Tax=Micromonospora sp. WMMD961 TaxID=3016100 RepID=UPI00241733BD|nr:hypothetical protein [Micromonospora sp. WMMD961]MDG4783209.1 hypothetical protein [Micromonospora sp. WMMD961]